MFDAFLFELRDRGLPVGVGEWLAFLQGMRLGLATDLDGLYHLGRSVLCRGEGDYDTYDLAFARTFAGASLPDDVREQLNQWLADAIEQQMGPEPERQFETWQELWEAFLERLREQTDRHDGGNRWVGTGGTSPFGNAGTSVDGIRVGGSAGGRSAVRVAMDRQWANYRGDRTLDIRDLTVVLRTLRAMVRDGRLELDLDDTIDATANNGGDIEIVERPERKNKLRVVLLMDAGGSMAPHAERVERLFSAAKRVKTLRSLDVYFFHNCVYQWLYTDIEQLERVPTSKVMTDLRPQHRLIFVGDASMAPYELFSSWGWPGDDTPAGIDWLRRLRSRCPGSVWLNPEPRKWWRHPTVSAIGQIFPMYELTVEGLGDAVKKLRVPI